MSNLPPDNNLLFQSEFHPLVTEEFETIEEYCLFLIHTYAYEYAARLAQDKSVLDLGCNCGYGTNILAQKCSAIHGVDVSQLAIDTARKKFKRDNLRFQLVDGRSLPFPDHSFDMVTSFQVIEHIEDVGPFIMEVTRVLRPSGIAVFTTPNASIRLDEDMRPWNPFHVREYTAAGFGALLNRYFSSVDIRGLFGTGELYSIEYQRLQAARQRAREQQAAPREAVHALTLSTPSPTDRIKRALPRPVFRALKETKNAAERLRARLCKNFQNRPEVDLGRFSLDDLFYRNSDFDRALDFLAICRISSS